MKFLLAACCAAAVVGWCLVTVAVDRWEEGSNLTRELEPIHYVSREIGEFSASKRHRIPH